MKTKNLINQFLQILFISVLVLSAGSISASTGKCIAVDPGSSKSANADSSLTGTAGANIANFNFSINGDAKLGCPSVTIKKMSFVISNKKNVQINNIKLDISGTNPTTLIGTVSKNTIYFVFPEEYTIKTGNSAHFSMYANVGKIDGTSSGQLQVYYKTMDAVNTETKKSVKSPKSVSDNLKLLVLSSIDHDTFKSLSRIRNEVKAINLTGWKNYSFCIDEKNTIPKLENHSAKNAIGVKSKMCR